MKWFVYVDAEYYAYHCICEADTAQEAAALAVQPQRGNTYPRYADESGEEATPACAVVPFAHVVFVGSENRIRGIINPDWEA